MESPDRRVHAPATLRAVVLAVAALPAVAGGRQQQLPRYAERVDVTRVLVDARVVDDAGRPVLGLDVADFAVKIAGRSVRVESVQWISAEPAATLPPLESTGLRGSVEPPLGRLVVFLFQKSLESSRIVGLMRMLIETRGFLETLGPNDRVAVLSFDSRLRIWIDFTNDLGPVRRIFEHGILFESPRPVQAGPDPSLVGRLDAKRAARAFSVERALLEIGKALKDLPGAKSVVLVGHGFGRLSMGRVVMESEYDDAREALQAARASVFCLDVTDADYHSLEAGLQLVAEQTGGFFARTHLFHQQALDRLAGALAGYYVLFTEKPELASGTHRIEVRLTRRKGNVLARNALVQ